MPRRNQNAYREPHQPLTHNIPIGTMQDAQIAHYERIKAELARFVAKG